MLGFSYTLRPLTTCFGAEATGVDLSLPGVLRDPAFMTKLKADVRRERALLFRGQDLTGEQQVEISKHLGRVESTFYKHPKSPHPDIFRVSNVEEEGCRNVGRSGWHIDGTFVATPFAFQTMFFPSVIEGGDTYFVPLKELYESLPNEQRSRWDRLWMVTASRRGGREGARVHPLVCSHPYRRGEDDDEEEPTLVFHCGEPFVDGWIEETETVSVDDPSAKMLPSALIQQEITQAIEARMDAIGLKMKWQAGDFLITDNLGLAHYACLGTQKRAAEVGVRILHRTTVVGGDETVPRKADGRRSFEKQIYDFPSG